MRETRIAQLRDLRSRTLAPNVDLPAAMMKLTPILCVFVLASCMVGERAGGGDSDRQGDTLDSIPQHPTTAACSGGQWQCYALIRSDGEPGQRAGGGTGFGAADLASAYKLNTSLTPGATIALVDAYDYPNAESDLAQYRSKYGLPACTTSNGCFKRVNQNGQTSPLPNKSPAGDDWTVEAALDLDLASAACPHCKLVLVEAQDDQGDGLFIAQNGAAAVGATVISNSWGGPSTSSDASFETYFNHPGIGIFVASGDNGWTGTSGDYPSTSAHVTGVGGTSLVQATNTRGWTEGAWSSGGSSCSKTIAKPSYQTSTACSGRMAADVSAVADPNTGLAVYNASNGGWIVVGGTSAASPFVAGVYALYGLGSNAPGWPYSNASKFFDVTTGKNGSCGNVLCNSGAGWDGPTGIGTPNGAALGGGTTCTPNCSGKACGDDGCGGSCGSCGSTQSCSGGVCIGGTGGMCSHPICSTGGKLTSSCDSCAASVCSQDSYCCNTAWDSICVGEVGSICGESCSGSGGGSSCAHSICSTGTKLTSSCDTCAADICSLDAYCCVVKWDSQCVGEVSSICGESCN
jgi:hypothetical protein